MEFDDPYIGFEELIALENTIIEEEGECEEQQEVEVDGVEGEEELEEGGDETGMGGFFEVNRLRPCLGMQFGTAEEAYNFYNAYGCHVGFSIRRATTSSSKKGVSSVRFVCSKEGYSKHQRVELKGMSKTTNLKTPEREYGTTKTNCKASLRVQ
jgi:FAR1 DNA-binding domain